eukprot:403338179
MEKKKVLNIKEEYQQILEKLPEGILIAVEDEAAEYMNQELKQFLNIAGENYERGLAQKLFKKLNMNNEDHNHTESNIEGGKIHTTQLESTKINDIRCVKPQHLTSLQDFLIDKEWSKEGDHFYELNVQQEQHVQQFEEEERIFTHIQKLDIFFKQKPAQMVIIRNISHIIHYEKAKNENKYQELLTQTMSHEMLTPLNSIIIMSTLVEQKIQAKFLLEGGISGGIGSSVDKDAQDIKQSLDYLGIVKSSANILMFLVKDLLDLMYIKQNLFSPELRTFSTIEACQDVMKCYKFQADEKKINLSLEVSDLIKHKITNIKGDKTRYQQILLNIVQNGIKFTQTGEVKVKISILGGHLCSECGFLETSVQDTGIGIAEEKREKLFKLFAMINDMKETTISIQGIGLGLSICKQLTEKLGGTIKLESIVNQGTEVTFTFPFQCQVHDAESTINGNVGLIAFSGSNQRSNPESFCDNITQKSGHSNKSRNRPRQYFGVEIFQTQNINISPKYEDQHQRIPTSGAQMVRDGERTYRNTNKHSIRRQVSQMQTFQNYDNVIESQTVTLERNASKHQMKVDPKKSVYQQYGGSRQSPSDKLYYPEDNSDIDYQDSLILAGSRSIHRKSFHSVQPNHVYIPMHLSYHEKSLSGVVPAPEEISSSQHNQCLFKLFKSNDLKQVTIINNSTQKQLALIEEDIQDHSIDLSEIMLHHEKDPMIGSAANQEFCRKKPTGYFPQYLASESRYRDSFQEKGEAPRQLTFYQFRSGVENTQKMKFDDNSCSKDFEQSIQFKQSINQDSQDMRLMHQPDTKNDQFESGESREQSEDQETPINTSQINHQINQVDPTIVEQDSELEETGNKHSSYHQNTLNNQLNDDENDNTIEDVSNALMMYDAGATEDNHTLKCSCETQILIVDDNMFNLLPLELILKQFFQVTVDRALNGQEAVNMFQKNLLKKCCNLKYKLVLMDLNMPVMDGYDATAIILQKFWNVFPEGHYPNGDQLFIVAITAFVNDTNIKKCYKVGMKEVLHKPINFEALGKVIDQYFYYRTVQQ